MDAIQEDGLAVGEVVQDVANRPLPRRVRACEVALMEREALQRLVTGPFKLSDEERGYPSLVALLVRLQFDAGRRHKIECPVAPDWLSDPDQPIAGFRGQARRPVFGEQPRRRTLGRNRLPIDGLQAAADRRRRDARGSRGQEQGQGAWDSQARRSRNGTLRVNGRRVPSRTASRGPRMADPEDRCVRAAMCERHGGPLHAPVRAHDKLTLLSGARRHGDDDLALRAPLLHECHCIERVVEWERPVEHRTQRA